MGAPSDYFVDSIGGNDSNDGSIGSPWQHLQHGWNSVLRDSANGDRLNLKSGGVHFLSGAIDLTIYGSTSQNAPGFMQGYDTAQGDGGIADIDGSGSSIKDTQSTGFYLIDAKLHNTGENIIWNGGVQNHFVRCEFHDSNLKGISTNTGSTVIGCYFHAISGIGLTLTNSQCCFCHFEDGATQTFGNVAAISVLFPCTVAHCTFDLNGSEAILGGAAGTIFLNCTAFDGATSGTGYGGFNSGHAGGVAIINCYAEGFPKNFFNQAGTHRTVFFASNKSFDGQPDEFDMIGHTVVDAGDNTTLAATAFLDRIGGNFAPTSALQGIGFDSTPKGLPNTTSFLDIGAIQHEEIVAAGDTVQGLATFEELGG